MDRAANKCGTFLGGLRPAGFASGLAATAACLLTLLGAADAVAQEEPRQPQERATGVQMVARLSQQPLDIVRTQDGRVISTLYTPETQRTQLVEIQKDATIRPFPSEEWNKPRQPNGVGFTEVVGLATGEHDYLAILDRGNSTHLPRIIVWDLKAEKVLVSREFDRVMESKIEGRLFQDLAIDTKHKCVYAAATSKDRRSGTLIVADFETGNMRGFTVAERPDLKPAEARPLHESTIDASKIADGETTLTDQAASPQLESLANGLNVPIAIDPAHRWVYFGSPDGKVIFRIAAATLAKKDLTQQEFVSAVEAYGTKEYSSHIAADAEGNVYCAEVNDTTIGVFSPGRQYRNFVRDEVLDRPYGIAIGQDGYLYITVNQVHRLGQKTAVPMSSERPYLVARVALRNGQ